jgi:hypothetical protein
LTIFGSRLAVTKNAVAPCNISIIY